MSLEGKSMEQEKKICPFMGGVIDCAQCCMMQLQNCIIKNAMRALPRIADALDDLNKLDYIEEVAEQLKKG